ncbi:MAG: glycoside hydrolase family 3 C-terminal domain-containing protein, partial [Clostridia bacterium]|nr:glycoside hydrolase family 3 C-terminal domain-containing protein [Clostridia bacterium]
FIGFKNLEQISDHTLEYNLSVLRRLKEDFPDGVGYIHDNYSVPKIMNRLQRFFIENSRLGIPVIFTGEALHGICGVRGTILPIPTALAATFEPELAYDFGRIVGKEGRSLGIMEVLCPNLDVAREPRWGRTEETFGEDTFLAAEMGTNLVKGHQNGDISANDSVISEPKHFCVHGIPESGINCSPARAGTREVESCYLPVFEQAIKEGGACDVMISYNCIDSDLLMTSSHYMKDVLKERIGLKGICRSDWGGLRRINILHKMAKDPKEAIFLAKSNGLDCQGGDEYENKLWIDSLVELIDEGRIDVENINESCRRVLKLKFKLGLFENPYTDEERYKSVINAPEHLEKALEIAQKSATLIKNNGILPLDFKKYKKVALIGPSTDRVRLGGYCTKPEDRHLDTVYDVLKRELPENEILQSHGCAIGFDNFKFELGDQHHLAQLHFEALEDSQDEALKIAKQGDVIIFCGGDDDFSSGEGRDRCDISLCGKQKELLEKLSELGKPIVLVLIHGRPLAIADEVKFSDAVLSFWFNGEQGAQAVFDVLSGKVNPAGRLPFSLPRNNNMIPCYYSMLPGRSNNYYEGDGTALYEFGYGLSYTKFDYTAMTVEKTGKTDAKVKVTVKNSGGRAGDEVVQIYVEDCESTVVTPDVLLKAFKRITLEPGEEKTVEFDLDYNAFRLMNAKYEWVVEPGTFRIYAGASSRNLRLNKEIVL